MTCVETLLCLDFSQKSKLTNFIIFEEHSRGFTEFPNTNLSQINPGVYELCSLCSDIKNKTNRDYCFEFIN